MDALIMCGGRGTRLDAETEKPLYEIAATPMIDRVISALAVSRIDTIHAVVSPQTPATRRHLDSKSGGGACRLVDAPGEGYVADLQYALEQVDSPVLTVAADLPLLDDELVNKLLDRHETGSLSVYVPDPLKRAIGVSSDTTMEHDGQRIASTGVNVVGAGAESVVVSYDVRLAVNVNYPEDASVAESLLGERSTGTARSTGGVETAHRVGREPHGSSDRSDVLDFSANTNPVVPSGTAAVYREAFPETQSYPAEPPEHYCEAAAAFVDCEPGSVVPTPGGLAAIRRTIELAVSPGESVLVPAPSFGEYAREVRLQGGEPVFVDEAEILKTDPAGHALAVVCNPNNPTGRLYDRDELERFAAECRAAGTTLLVDEAFLGFTDQGSLAGTDGVVVSRALTKLFGMPGIRAGFAVGTGRFGEALRATRRTWNLSAPALAVSTHCLRQSEFVAETRKRVDRERERLREELSESFDVAPSNAPFLLLDVGGRSVDTLLDAAEERGVVLRDARTFRGLDNHVRTAVRLPTENDRLLEVLGDV
jgi:histidinol-phosphate/aromatic aminotransferase/cobyric acid decarboxylase-like protein/GTP:adenosylcobinamide-phosphate guanylyltransferase